MSDTETEGQTRILLGAGGTTGSQDDPIALIEAEHACLLQLCDVLEQIADQLPNRVSRTEAYFAAAHLKHGLLAHTNFEEQELFPLLRQRAFFEYPIRSILCQLEQEHEADESYAIEIAEELQIVATRGQARNGEMLGYMLRGFFISQRRHIQWENALLLPLARELLQPQDLARLSRRLAARAVQRPRAPREAGQYPSPAPSERRSAEIIPIRR
ncbi:MAG: hemerythrin domain-containing protein [Methyloligellaceae bacterium]